MLKNWRSSQKSFIEAPDLSLRLTNILQVEELCCWRGDRLLFTDLNFTLKSGNILSLEGRNGAGKSSLLALLAGLLKHYSGRIKWNDDLLTGSDVFWLGPQAPFYPHLSLLENLLFWAGLNEFSKENVLEALDYYELLTQQDLEIALLSRGQIQRAHLCRLHLNTAAIWLLDEPTAGLDEFSERLLDKAIETFCQRGGMIVVAPHMPRWPIQTLNIEHFHPHFQQARTP